MRRSRRSDDGRESNDDAIDAAAQAFRYEHDLITAEETERWLADRGLTLSDFGDYFARRVLGRGYRYLACRSRAITTLRQPRRASCSSPS